VLVVLFAVVIVLGIGSTCGGRPSLKALLKDKEHIFKQLDKATEFVKKGTDFIRQNHIRDLTIECALCGIAINEVEGFMIENLTLTAIENALKLDVCTMLGSLNQMCDDLINKLPYIIKRIEDRWTVSNVCIDLKYCDMPFTPFPDPETVPTYVINLDLPPWQRWQQPCTNSVYQQTAQFLTNTVDAILPDHGAALEEIGSVLNQFYYPSELAQEISGCSLALGVSEGWGALFNLGYEVSDACTSIVAQTTDGTVLHARNLDFWAGMGFTDSLKNMTFKADFRRSGRTVFKATTFAGFVGILSGIKPGGFSITINTRFYPGGIMQMFYEIIAAMEEKNASLVSFLSRNVLNNENDFESALYGLSNDELIADVYYTVAGSKPGQGAVLSRNRHNATNVWRLMPPQRWFLVQTNYDHWTQPPWFDDRVVPATNALKAIGQSSLSQAGLFGVLSVKPVLNIQTTYSILGVPKNGSWSSWTRWCPFPCVE